MTTAEAAAAALACTTERDAMEALASHAYGDEPINAVIRPAAILPETAARQVLAALAIHDARTEGRWVAEPARWRRYDKPWNGPGSQAGTAQLLGSLQVIYGRPSRYEITVYRATITPAGAQTGLTVETLCDEAFSFGGLTLADCPRAQLTPPPAPFRIS